MSSACSAVSVIQPSLPTTAFARTQIDELRTESAAGRRGDVVHAVSNIASLLGNIPNSGEMSHGPDTERELARGDLMDLLVTYKPIADDDPRSPSSSRRTSAAGKPKKRKSSISSCR